MAPRKKSVTEIAQDAEGSAEGEKVAKATGRSVPGKRKATPKRKTVRRRRADRSTAATKAGGRKPTKSRLTAAEIVTRNAEIAKLREVDLLMWGQIAARFEIDEKTARRGYDAHIEAQEAEAASFVTAMKDMRRYVQVLVRDQQALAQIAHDLEMSEPEVVEVEGADSITRDPKQIKHDIRSRIAAIHEKNDLMFKEIAVRQAIGDLPTRFAELVSSRDWEQAYERAMEVLKRHDIPHAVFVEIAEAMDERVDASIPKTHLAAVNE